MKAAVVLASPLPSWAHLTARLTDFVVLMKPRVMSLAIFTALVGLMIAPVTQMGVHLVFFLHITTGPDNTNNVLALAFGVLIVFLVVVGSLWIMTNLNDNMMRPAELMNSHMQH
jgi:cytochrome o ubiquinol oxidase subunit IV